jgi:hypothetical protein
MDTLDQYLNVKQELDTALERNEQSQAVYRKDLIYLFFKVLLFVVLAIVFTQFRKRVEKVPVKV